MVEDNDYIMRLVHELVRTLAKLIFGRDFGRDEEAELPVEKEEQYRRLLDLIDRGEIDTAENLLLDGLEENDMQYFELAIRFYQKLNRKSDDFLEEHDFSREEIVDGIKYVVNYYGYGNIMEAFAGDLERIGQ